MFTIHKKKQSHKKRGRKNVAKMHSNYPPRKALRFLGHRKTNKVSSFATFPSYQTLWSGTTQN